ncbi:hypothetical protein NBRC10512_006441 [Rhodotorula toruloides]|uniref:RHTO0S03e12464g1_1 n=2 Tax=Rhodotorula toruloides TaxID=5286 RepID=A0A061AVE3_RHOTO|nr:uncharacterized protein RHTO_00585 [Rhodotorula toruloides NP11]EMS26157.1 hypothetical protein RHTO_00585 [Rhodotorula toruloides NP11]CDR38711.1 RHTO0S03e12464g1_1 [Rhodotorula toruloides]
MPAISPAAIPAFLSRLSSRLAASPAAPPPTAFILPLVAATTLSHGKTWLKPCIDLAFSSCPPRPSPIPYEPPHPLDDASLHPRRFAVSQIKEALFKSSILIGVPKAIETLLELGDVVEEEDMSKAFVRSELSLPEQTVTERWVNGQDGLRSVYQDQLDDIFTLMAKLGLEDLEHISQCVTYGTFLTPYSTRASSSPTPDPLAHDPKLLSVVTLSALIPQRTEREILWHLRGAIRRGWKRDEVEKLQASVEEVCEACGVEDVGRGMPRVADVERLPEEEHS